MRGKTEQCQKPKELKGRPGECSPEQIRKCHGRAKAHPCVKQAQSRQARRTAGPPTR